MLLLCLNFVSNIDLWSILPWVVWAIAITLCLSITFNVLFISSELRSQSKLLQNVVCEVLYNYFHLFKQKTLVPWFIFASVWLKFKKSLWKLPSPNDFLVGINNICEVLHRNSSYGFGQRIAAILLNFQNLLWM